MKTSQSGNRWWLYIVLLFLISSLQYAYTLGNGFVWDSETVILKDPTIRDYKYLPSYFTQDTLKHTVEVSERVFVLKYYRPLVKILYLFEYKIFGTSPIGYHAVNLFLNALVVVLCFLFVLEVTSNIKIAFVSSIIYTVNPSRAEAVNWVNSASNILMALFSMVSLLSYHRRKYALSLISFGAALLTRESAVLLPVVFILYEFFIKKQKELKGYTKILPFFVVTGIYLVVRQTVVGSPPITDVDVFTLFNTISVILKRFVKIFFLPDAPITIYQKELFSALTFEVVFSYFVVAGLLLLGAFIWLKKREYLFWYLWVFVWIAISFNVGKTADYLMSEKGLYLASLGFCVLIASLTVNLRIKNVIIVLISGIVIAHSAITFSRSFYWKDTITYLEKAVEFAPDMPLIRHSLGNAYSSQGLHDMAIVQFKKALKLNPTSSIAYYNLGNAYAKKGQYELSLKEFQEAVKWDPKNSMAYNNIGNIYYMMGDIDKAASAWEKAMKSDPENPQPYYNIGLLMEQNGKVQSALSYYRRFLSLTTTPPPEVVRHITEFEAETKNR